MIWYRIFKHAVLSVLLLVVFNFAGALYPLALFDQSYVESFEINTPVVINPAHAQVSEFGLIGSPLIIAKVASTLPQRIYTNKTVTKDFYWKSEDNEFATPFHASAKFQHSSEAELQVKVTTDDQELPVYIRVACSGINGAQVFEYHRTVNVTSGLLDSLNIPMNAINCELFADRAFSSKGIQLEVKLSHNEYLFKFPSGKSVKTIDFIDRPRYLLARVHYHEYVIVIPRDKSAHFTLKGRYTYPHQLVYDSMEIAIALASLILPYFILKAFDYLNLRASRFFALDIKKRNSKKEFTEENPNSESLCVIGLVTIGVGLLLAAVCYFQFNSFTVISTSQEEVFDLSRNFSAVSGRLHETPGISVALSTEAPGKQYKISYKRIVSFEHSKNDLIYDKVFLGILQRNSLVSFSADSELNTEKAYAALMSAHDPTYKPDVYVPVGNVETRLTVPAFGQYSLVLFSKDYVEGDFNLVVDVVANNVKSVQAPNSINCDLTRSGCDFGPPFKFVTVYGSSTNPIVSHVHFTFRKFTASKTVGVFFLVSLMIFLVGLRSYMSAKNFPR